MGPVASIMLSAVSDRSSRVLVLLVATAVNTMRISSVNAAETAPEKFCVSFTITM